MPLNEAGEQRLIEALSEASDVDLSRYRTTTVLRQINRRMQAVGACDPDAYLELLRDSTEEAELVRTSMFIAVTAFFRDAKVFVRLRRWLKERCEQLVKGNALRVWVPGCASGEEAYSIAIVLHEVLGARLGELDVHVFATDADERATRFARNGVYTHEAANGLSESMLAKHFVKERELYRVAKHLRDMCVFATHDLASQPPFRNMDLVSCRNVLIYFQPELRRSVLHKLHYALKPDGVLMLGQSEAVGPQDSLFESFDPQHKLYVRRLGSSPRWLDPTHSTKVTASAPVSSRPQQAPDLEAVAGQVLRSVYLPPSVVVTPRGEILHSLGDTHRYLQLLAGKSDFRITALCPPQLRGELKTLLHLLVQSDRQLSTQPVSLDETDPSSTVRVVGRRLSEREDGAEGNYLLSFETERVNGEARDLRRAMPEDVDPELSHLRQELAATREHLHSLVEELESANDRMLSVNQELQASSEEVQSSNEEIQASNEELLSLNEELQLKSQELTRANETLSSIQNSIQVGLVVLDADARIVSYNGLAVRIFGLMPQDRGRSITRIPCSLELPDLLALVQEAQHADEPHVYRIDADERHYLLQVSPYENVEHVRCGAVLAFTDVSELRRAEQESKRLHDHFRATFEQATAGIAHVSLEGRWLRVNRHWCEMLGYSEAELLTRTVQDVTYPDDRAAASENFEQHPLALRRQIEKRYQHKDGHVIWARVSYTTVGADANEPPYRVVVLQDITESRVAEEKLRASESEFRQVLDSLPLLPWSARPDGTAERLGPQWREYLGASFTLDQPWTHFVHPEDHARIAASWRLALDAEQPYQAHLRLRRHDGAYRWFELRARPVRDAQQRVVQWFGATSEVHDAIVLRERLENSLETLRVGLAGSQTASWVVEPPSDPGAGQNAAGNEDFWRLLGSPLDASHDHTARFEAAVHPEDAGPALAIRNAAFQNGEACEIIFRTHPDRGPIRWLLSRGRPLHDADGVCRRFHGVMIDITEQKRSEHAHQQAVRELTRANRLARIGHFSWGLDSGEMTVDAMVRELLDLGSQEITRELVRSRLEPAARDAARRSFEAALGRADTTHEQTLCFHIRGEPRWLHMALELEYGADQRPKSVLGAFRDVTLEHQAHLAVQAQRDTLEALVEARTHDLQQKERQLQAILNGLPCAIGYWDEQQRIRFANDAHASWFGYTPGQMTGKLMTEVWTDSFADGLMEHLAEVRNGRRAQYELEVMPPTADPTHESRFAGVYLLPDGPEGAVSGYFSLVFDITSLKRAERLADAASQAKGQFLANMSHEIRTPLTAVLGLAELGKRDAPTRQTQERFGSIQRAGQHLLTVISDILDFSRIEAGKLEIESAPVELADLLTQAVTTLGGAARDKHLALFVSELPGLPRTVQTDEARVAQVLINLLSNAIKFTDRGRVELTASYADESLTLQVADTGIGIAPETCKRLFEPFEQGSAVGGLRRAGTGLGLAICKRLVELMNGRLELDSQPSQGTVVRVTIPCRALAQANYQPLASTALVAMEPSQSRPLARDLGAVGCRVQSLPLVEALGADVRCIVTQESALSSLLDPKLKPWLAAGGRIVALRNVTSAEPQAPLPAWLADACAYQQQPASPLMLLRTLAQAAQPEPARAEPPLFGVRVLAAEDQEFNRALLREMLNVAGATLTLAEDGQKVVQQLRAAGPGAYDIVLCDVEMPELDGYEATVQMHQLEPDLPVVGLTAHAFARARERGQHAGMVDYLTKPYTLATLVKTIARNKR